MRLKNDNRSRPAHTLGKNHLVRGKHKTAPRIGAPSRAPSLDRTAAGVRKLKGLVVHWEGEEARREMALGEARESLSAARDEYTRAESQYMDACRQAID
jgi:hypothetical protein